MKQALALLDLGNQVKKLRTKRSLTLQDLADLTGLSKPNLSQIAASSSSSNAQRQQEQGLQNAAQAAASSSNEGSSSSSAVAKVESAADGSAAAGGGSAVPDQLLQVTSSLNGSQMLQHFGPITHDIEGMTGRKMDKHSTFDSEINNFAAE